MICHTSKFGRQGTIAGERLGRVTTAEDADLRNPRVLEAVPGVPGAYLVLNRPAALAGMPYPRGNERWVEARAAGFGLLLSLSQESPAYDPAPLRSEWFPLEDLAHGGDPAEPRKDAINLRCATDAVLAQLATGCGAIIHCDGGRGRTGSVLGLVMVRLGFTPSSAQAWLNQANRTRGKPGWPESPWQALQLSQPETS